jgi:predicted ATPase/DNA-binding CsgD family transcriptional regulator
VDEPSQTEPHAEHGRTGPKAPRTVRQPLIGREVEVSRAVDLMRTDGVRLVTITGRAGVGKSVLADEVVRRLMILDPVGVAEVRLSGRAGPVELSGLVAALDRHIGEAADGTAPLGRTRMVLVDGADVHHDVVASSVSRALDADPDLAVMVTCAQRLALRGEHVLPLEPLELPDPRADRPDSILQSPAVQLFVERVRRVAPDFGLDAASALDAAHICRRLDGLPLALELAAARCASLTPAEVLELVRASALDVASGGSADAEAHHRSLRDAVRWSYGLLDEGAQRLLRHAGIFVASFDLDVLRAVLPDGASDTVRLLDQLGALSSAGLVVRSQDGRPGGHRLPPTVRDAALELLVEHGEVDAARERHTEHLRRRVRDAAPSLRSARSWVTAQELRPCLPDLVAAMAVLADQDDPRAALLMALHLQPLWTEASATQAALLVTSLGERIAARAHPGDADAEHLVAAARTAAANLKFWGAAVELEPLSVLDEAIEVADRLGVQHLALFARVTLVQTLIMADPLGRSLPAALEAIEVAETWGDEWWIAAMSSWGAVAANQQGDSALALELALRSQQLSFAAGDERQVLRTSFVLAGIDGAAEAPGAYLPSFEDQLQAARRVGDDQIEGWLYAAIASRRVMEGDIRGAALSLREGLSLGQRLGRWSVEQLCVAALTLIASFSGRPEDAARLHGGLASRLTDVRRMLSPPQFVAYEMAVDAACAQLGEARFGELAASGRIMGWRAVLELADEVIDQLVDPAPTPVSDSAPTGPLTDRELEVLELIADGWSNKEIAVTLGLRPKTVMHHSSNIYRKLGVRTRAQAAATAHRRGLLPRSAG